MYVETLGEGTPEVAIVGGIHGDEPCGVRAVESLVDDRPAVERPVKLVVANEPALEASARYLERDLNRSFPGDLGGETNEGRLAARLARELEGCRTLALHSTRSSADPFAVVDSLDDRRREWCTGLPVRAVVEAGPFTDGRIFAAVPDALEVECGLQGSTAAAENAVRLSRAFLAETGVLPEAPAAFWPDGDGPAPGDGEAGADGRSRGGSTGPVGEDIPVFRLTERVAKRPASAYEVFAPNFEEVAAGAVYAAADGDELVADEPFYPVLMSADGYEDVFGYAARRRTTLSRSAGSAFGSSGSASGSSESSGPSDSAT